VRTSQTYEHPHLAQGFYL